MSLRVSTLVVLALGAGCVMAGCVIEDATDDGEPPDTAEVDQQSALCDGWLCGTNSPEIAGFGFWELNLPTVLGSPGLPNNVGLRIVEFVHNNIAYLPRVHRGRLTATRRLADGTVITLASSALVNGWFKLTNGMRTFRLRVVEVGTVDSWAQPTNGGRKVVLESYRLDWLELNAGGGGVTNLPPKNVCTHPPGRESPDVAGTTGNFVFHTLLFEGDRIHAVQKLDTGIDLQWFNLGCAGGALAKMALTGHTEASRNANTFHTTLPERQAMLKLLAADYCNDGTPFTVPGQPLNWRDDRDTMKLIALLSSPQQPLVLEARWTDQGPACLDKPRVDAHWTALGAATFGANVYGQVMAHCPTRMPPSCADSSFNTAGYHLLSATVPFQP
jgi:ADYC domain